MPDPRVLSDLAAELLQPQRSSLLYVSNLSRSVLLADLFILCFRPSESLSVHRKRICEICTEDPSRPIMIEEGKEWKVHVKSRGHKNKAGREQHLERIRRLKEALKATAKGIDKA